MKLRNSIEFCRNCNANFQGEPIPKKDQHLFGATHFSRKIGIYSMETDRTEEYQCPDCQHKWRAYEVSD